MAFWKKNLVVYAFEQKVSFESSLKALLAID